MIRAAAANVTRSSRHAPTYRSIRGIVEKRPWTCTALTVTSGISIWAVTTEYKSKRNNEIQLPRKYDWDLVHTYWENRPVTTVRRMMELLYHITPLASRFVLDFVILDNSNNESIQREHAILWKDTLTKLGPTFVKMGQQLSIRPDLLPAVVLAELQKLCDQVQPVPDDIAFNVLKKELKINNLDEVFVNGKIKLVASASLGQVYQAEILVPDDDTSRTKRRQQKQKHIVQKVAVKVQRPDMLETFSLDLYILQRIGLLVDTFTSIFTNQQPFHKKLYETFASGSYSELDYENEAINQILFKNELQIKRHNMNVIIPKVYEQYTTRNVLTTEWIDGIKLADANNEQIQKLIPIGVELFLTQLLDIGMFHADPHVGNILVNDKNQLCLLDFGLCATVQEHERKAMTAAIIHLLTRDFDALVQYDAKELGFLPYDLDVTELKPILTKILTVGLIDNPSSNMKIRKRKLMEISSELNHVFFQYPFSVPPFFALVTRGLGLLEGIALAGDPNFDIFQASAPYARKHAMQIFGINNSRNNFLRGMMMLKGRSTTPNT